MPLPAPAAAAALPPQRRSPPRAEKAAAENEAAETAAAENAAAETTAADAAAGSRREGSPLGSTVPEMADNEWAEFIAPVSNKKGWWHASTGTISFTNPNLQACNVLPAAAIAYDGQPPLEQLPVHTEPPSAASSVPQLPPWKKQAPGLPPPLLLPPPLPLASAVTSERGPTAPRPIQPLREEQNARPLPETHPAAARDPSSRCPRPIQPLPEEQNAPAEPRGTEQQAAVPTPIQQTMAPTAAQQPTALPQPAPASTQQTVAPTAAQQPTALPKQQAGSSAQQTVAPTAAQPTALPQPAAASAQQTVAPTVALPQPAAASALPQQRLGWVTSCVTVAPTAAEQSPTALRSPTAMRPPSYELSSPSRATVFPWPMAAVSSTAAVRSRSVPVLQHDDPEAQGPAASGFQNFSECATMLWNQGGKPVGHYVLACTLPSAAPFEAPGKHRIKVFPGANPTRLICYIPGAGGNATDVLDFSTKEHRHARTLASFQASTVFVVEDPGKWKTPLKDWLVVLLQSVIELKPPGGRLSIVGFSRGAWWSSELLRRLKPEAILAIDGILLLAPYGSPGHGQAAGQEIGRLLMQCGRPYVVASKSDARCPWATWAPWLTGVREVAGDHVCIVQHWTHEQVRSAIIVGDASVPILAAQVPIVAFAQSVLFG